MKKLCFLPRIHMQGGFLLVSAVCAAASGIFLLGAAGVQQRHSAAVSTEEPVPVIVIDAGHGGEDGGAVAADGTVEKDLNLEVAHSLAQMLSFAGYDVRMTRTEDRMLYDLYGEAEEYAGRKKTYDLRNRLRFAEEADASLFISIHMNKFPQTQYSGLQVYYAAAQGSDTVAEAVQSAVRTYLQPENTRQTKRTDSSIYLLHRIRIPAVMIECGFLSNEEELHRLQNGDYRRALALCIACAVSEVLG